MSLLTPGNYLELLQRAFVDCGITDSPPTTAQNATGQVQAMAHLLNQQWLEIQSKHDDWNFMRVTQPGASFVTIAGQQIYTVAGAGISRGVVSSWARDTFRVYLTSTGTPGEIPMEYWPYDAWRNAFQISSLRTAQTMPINFSIAPNNSIALQCPLVGYTITGDYYSAPLDFSADADVPSIPPQFVMLLVYKTMMVYGMTESAPEVYSQGKMLYDPLMSKLENQRLREIQTSGALA